MIVHTAPHARGLNAFGPRIDVVLRGKEFLNYNPNPAARGPLSRDKVIVVNNVRYMTETADKRVYSAQSVGRTESVKVTSDTRVDSVYVNGHRNSFGGSLADLLDLIDNRTPTAWDRKQ